MHTIVVTVGTRPEAIKMAPIYLELRKSATLKPLMLSTGQHRQMLDQALGSFGIVPDHDLELMQPGQTLPDLTARVLTRVTEFLATTQAAAVLVQGDTTTVLAAGLAAAYAKLPLGHVEAGLRTHDMSSPWPEELNRRLTSPLARWSFVPTETSRQNLLQERISDETIHVTGNSVIDALLWVREKVRRRTEGVAGVVDRLSIPPAFGARYLANDGPPWILVTGHRRESFGQGFETICQSLLRLVDEHPDLGILYPVHLNPQVREPVNRLLSKQERMALIEPASYEDFVWLMDRCRFLLSDSGGVQEEAPSFGKPVLVMRDNTERPEGVTAGTCRLVGANSDNICREAALLLTDEQEYRRRSALANPYGDGQTSARIRRILERDLAEA